MRSLAILFCAFVFVGCEMGPEIAFKNMYEGIEAMVRICFDGGRGESIEDVMMCSRLIDPELFEEEGMNDVIRSIYIIERTRRQSMQVYVNSHLERACAASRQVNPLY